jgi:hypothetical protein
VQRIQDYKEACIYIRDTVGNQKRALEFLKIVEDLKRMLESIANGTKIDILKIHPPLAPHVILGYSEEERLEKFNAVFSELNKQFEEFKEKARKCIEGGKNPKLKKDQIDHLDAEAKNFIAKAKEVKIIADEINEKKRNVWQAPPTTHMETVFEKKERTLDSIQPNQLIVELITNE